MNGYATIASQIAALRARGDHRGARALAATELDRHPDQWHALMWMQITAAAQEGATDEMLMLLERAVERGDWYPPENVAELPGAAALSDNQRFQSIAAICIERRDEALLRVRPALTIQRPSSPPPWPALVVLHGNGEPIASVTEQWSGTERLLAAPQSGTVSGPSRYVWAAATTGEVRRHVATLAELGAVDGDVVIGGFGRGAYHALRLALTGYVEARGVIAVAPAMNDISEIEGSLSGAAARGLRVAFVVGTDDFTPARSVPRVAEQLQRAGIDTTVEMRHKCGREYPPDFAALLPQLLDVVAPR